MTTTRSPAASGSGRLLAFISIAMVVDLGALVLLGSLAEERPRPSRPCRDGAIGELVAERIRGAA